MKNILEKKQELLGWYEIYLRLFRLIKTDEQKKQLNESWGRIKTGLEKLYSGKN